MTLSEIAREASEIGQLQDAVKQQAMIYDGAMKSRIMEHFGLSFEEVDLPFEDYMVLKDLFLKEERL